MNEVKNLSIIMEDITTTELVLGTDLGGMKGKAARQTPSLLISNITQIPRELITITRV